MISQGCGATLPDGRQIYAGKIEGGIGLAIRITRPLQNGIHSELQFALTWEATRALHDVLCAQIRSRKENPQPGGDVE